MTATETITTNLMILGADPFEYSGFGEDLLTIILPYIKSAKVRVFRIGKLLEKYGAYESKGIRFQDENEIWCVNNWWASFYCKKIPDDSYVVAPNQFSIQNFDCVDAFGEQKNNIYSKDLINFIEKNHLDLSIKGDNKKIYIVPQELGTCLDILIQKLINLMV